MARLAAAGATRGSPASAALAATISALAEAETLPGLLDTASALPPTGARAFVRRVGGRNLWVWYRLDGEGLVLLTVSSVPPAPVG